MEKIVNLFPTPIMLVDMSDIACKQRLLEILDNEETQPHELVENGQSNFGFSQILFHPELEELKNAIEHNLNRYTKNLGVQPVMIANNWFNIMNKGSKVVRHRHEGSVISGAYYPRAPEGSTKLHFVNPLIPYRMTEIYSYETPYSRFEQNVDCMEDLMILFPSWLEHYTEINDTENRTVISFNTASYYSVEYKS